MENSHEKNICHTESAGHSGFNPSPYSTGVRVRIRAPRMGEDSESLELDGERVVDPRNISGAGCHFRVWRRLRADFRISDSLGGIRDRLHPGGWRLYAAVL